MIPKTNRTDARSGGARLAVVLALALGLISGGIWVRSASPVRELNGHNATVSSVSWSPDSKRVATGSWDKTVRVWDAATGKTERILTAPRREVNAISWSPDGALIAAASEDASGYVWNANTGASVGQRLFHHDSVHAVAFSPNGTYLATSGRGDRTVKLWDAAVSDNFGVYKTLAGHEGWAGAVAFKPGGTTMATTDKKGVRLWDVPGGRLLGVLPGSGPTPHFAAWSPDGKAFVCGGAYSQARLFDARAKRAIRAIGSPRFNSAAFSPDGKTFLTTGDFRVELWDARTGKLKIALVRPGLALRRWPLWVLRWVPALRPARARPVQIHAAAFSPDGKRIAFAHDNKVTILPAP